VLLTGIIGYPLKMTLSPKMHNATFKALGIDGLYVRLPVQKEKFGETIKGLVGLGFQGVNMTIPYKEKVMEYLDEIEDEAREVGAVNTILIEKDRLIGYNTDIYGFRKSLTEYKIKIKNKDLLLIGAGGASRACAYVMNLLMPRRLFITDKSLKRARSLAHKYNGEVIKTSEIRQIIRQVNIVINGTPVDFQGVALPEMKRGSVYFDLNYKFKGRKQRDIRVINGLLMLVLQGARSFELWTGVRPSVELMKRSVRLV